MESHQNIQQNHCIQINHYPNKPDLDNPDLDNQDSDNHGSLNPGALTGDKIPSYQEFIKYYNQNCLTHNKPFNKCLSDKLNIYGFNSVDFYIKYENIYINHNHLLNCCELKVVE